MNQAYLERRDYIQYRLEKMGFTVQKPGGAFYIFHDISFTDMDDWDFAVKLLEEQHMAVLPGSAFSKYGAGHIRISFASSMDNLTEGMNRLESFINSLHRS